MQAHAGNRRLWLGLGLLAWAGATLTLLAILLFVFVERQAADYPNSLLVSDHDIYRWSPYLTVRRDTSYRTMDEFPVVYNWYSSGFNLGPEVRAQSACILMARSTTALAIVERSMSVTLCDTPTGRMIFVQRSVSLRYRR